MAVTVGVVPVIVAMSLSVTISTPFRVERCGYRGQASAELGDHVLNNVIPPNSERFVRQLGREMAISQMPGNPDKMRRVVGFDFHQIFCFSQDLDNFSVFQLEPVTVMQMYGVRLIQKESQTTCPGEHSASAIPVFPIQRYAVGRFAGPGFCRVNGSDTDHYAESAFVFIAWNAGRSRRRLK